MKKIFVFLITTIICLSGYTQLGINSQTPWRFMKGDSSVPVTNPVYGQQGVPSEGNQPGSRNGSVTWNDAQGNVWLFGGYGSSSLESGLLNDLWKYDVTLNQWIFIKGDNIIDVPGIYGIKGHADIQNKPGARAGAVSWVDQNGNLWLFGGFGFYTGGSGFLNDLWKYEPATNQWTWKHGDNAVEVQSTTGTRGIAAPENTPGGRESATAWVDNAGKLWLYGGSFGTARTGDLWRYDPDTNEWTWMKGYEYPCAENGFYGVQGVPGSQQNPGCMAGGVSWKDNAGNLWLFGGGGIMGYFNSLWKYTISSNQWTWMKGDSTEESLGHFGTKGVASVNNKPRSSSGGTSWTDNAGNLWLFGGIGTVGYHLGDYLNTLWKYDPVINQWTWIKGDSNIVHRAVYGTMGIENGLNKPGSKFWPMSAKDNNGNLLLFGGTVYYDDFELQQYFVGSYNDLWRFNTSTNNWSWIKGDTLLNQAGIYGEDGFIAEGNIPGRREGSVTWKDASGNLWLFGGDGLYTYNDLWKYNTSSNQWVWMKGSNAGDDPGNYGTKGVANNNNNPPARYNSISWIDASGNFWLFGGSSISTGIPLSDDLHNDLWKYNPTTNQWTWISGDNTFNSTAIYGTRLTEGVNNKPGARTDATSWIDASGYLWLQGGYGYRSAGARGYLNDLWRFNPANNRWTWMSGTNSINSVANYGTKGLIAPSNSPGARARSTSWFDATGNLWLFGGYGYDGTTTGSLNDLWRYTITADRWTWMEGDNTVDNSGVYGSIGIPTTTTNPGARENSGSWDDGLGNFWLFGGYGKGKSGTGMLNDVWKYNRIAAMWTWIKGDSAVNALGVPGTKGAAAMQNNPISKEGPATWMDNAGNLWLYGGSAINREWANREDLFRFDTTTKVWTWIKGETAFTRKGYYGIKGVSSWNNKPGARASGATWTDTTGNLWLFGGSTESLSYTTYLNDLWKYDPTISQWIWMKGDSIENSYGRYGTKGTGHINNEPPSRSNAVTWVDNSGKLWLYGGEFFDVENLLNTNFNDLWNYDPATNLWTWVKGDSLGLYWGDNPAGNGIFGTMGTPAALNKPSARTSSVSWTDSIGNLWLFGGTTYNSGCSGHFNDLWRYNPGTNQWTWMKGDNVRNTVGVYGTQGTAANANKPGGRYGSTGWTDSQGKLWLFGGNNGNCEKMSDLWNYDPLTNRWTWMKGSQAADNLASYTNPDEEDASNNPGGRLYVSSWKDVYGNLWLHGGDGFFTNYYATLNDLWKYNPSTNNWTYYNGGVWQAGNPKKPGSRSQAMSWTDRYGDLWLFGGWAYGTSGNGLLNDLWKIYCGTKYVFTGNGDWSNQYNWINQLVPSTTIVAGMDVTIDHEIPGDCVNQGSISLAPYGRLRIESGKWLTINQGGLANAGFVIGPGNRPGKVLFTGTNTDSLVSTGSITTPLVLLDKTMYLAGNTNTVDIDLTGSTSRMTGTESTGESSITLGNYNLNMDTARLIANSTSFIITNGTGRLNREVKNNAAVEFPVGVNANSFNPVTITNTGSTDIFSVRVETGIKTNGSTGTPLLTGNVDRSWYISKETEGLASGNLTMRWEGGHEQPGFNRIKSYISHNQVCPPPVNCDVSFWDASPATAASVDGQGFVQFRANVSSFKTPYFSVTSKDVIYSFINSTGNGNWNTPGNWMYERVPPNIITEGMEVIIDPLNGACNFTGTLTVMPGGKLTVRPGKVFNIIRQ